ncbi:aldolase [Methanohalophilus sp.]|uniref:aldolase n=1 Tax=Methanohalophilus sp. TaxID=1966352 RepID=UPI002617BF7D|nr:aldolase [Methanohalophilus sp.]MDK2892889.1 L-fuculose-phosphate aldolase [Methanohalophilus sp.]
MWHEMARIGSKLVNHGLVESNFGNISVRKGENFIITRTGCFLDEITEDTVVEVPIDRNSFLDKIASSETIVHRQIYRNTDAGAIIHAHCPYSVILSLLQKDSSISPIDSEGVLFLGNVPIIRGNIGSEELAEAASRALLNHHGAIIYSHGTIAIGKDLDEAYVFTTQIEHSCKIRYFYDLARK